MDRHNLQTDNRSLPSRVTPQSQKLQHLRRIAFWLDNAIPIPGTKYRFGLDPLLGLFGIAAGSGDIFGGAIATYIIAQSAKMGVPRKVVWQMVGNVLLDSLLGLIPALGDLCDFAWKANTRNIVLLEQHLETMTQQSKGHPVFVFGITVLTVLIVIGCAFLTLLLIKTVLQL